MDFSITDFNDAVFDIVYAQASISSKMRNKIIKEIKRILKPEGILSVGEITSLKSSPPIFVNKQKSNGLDIPLGTSTWKYNQAMKKLKSKLEGQL